MRAALAAGCIFVLRSQGYRDTDIVDHLTSVDNLNRDPSAAFDTGQLVVPGQMPYYQQPAVPGQMGYYQQPAVQAVAPISPSGQVVQPQQMVPQFPQQVPAQQQMVPPMQMGYYQQPIPPGMVPSWTPVSPAQAQQVVQLPPSPISPEVSPVQVAPPMQGVTPVYATTATTTAEAAVVHTTPLTTTTETTIAMASEVRFFVVGGDKVVKACDNLEDAKKTLMSSFPPAAPRPSRQICEVRDGVVLPDPNDVGIGGQNQGLGLHAGFNKWWLDWNDIRRMNRICQQYQDGVQEATDLSNALERKVENVTKYLESKEMEDKHHLQDLVTQMKDIVRDVQYDTPPPWFTSTVGAPLPTSARKETETTTCASRIEAMNRQLWDKFRAYGSWNATGEQSSTSLETQNDDKAFQIAQALKSFALLMVQPFLDEPEHGPLGKPNRSWRTPNLWAGFSSECQNTDMRTLQEELESFQTLSNSYALYPGSHLAQILQKDEIRYLQGCSWRTRSEFWEARSKNFVQGMIANGIEEIFISVNKQHLEGKLGLEGSLLWTVQLPALGEKYGNPSLLKDGVPWRPRVQILEMTRNCSGMGLAIARQLQRSILRPGESKHVDIQCRECGDTLRHCLMDPVPQSHFNAQEQTMQPEMDSSGGGHAEAAPTGPESSADSAVTGERVRLESAALTMPSPNLKDPSLTAKAEAAREALKQLEEKTKKAREEWTKRCSENDMPDLDQEEPSDSWPRTEPSVENGRCPVGSHSDGPRSCSCGEGFVFSKNCREYALNMTMPERYPFVMSCRCIPDPRGSYVQTHVAAMEFCGQLVQAVYKKHTLAELRGNLERAAEEVEKDLKGSAAMRACEAALAHAENSSEAVDQITEKEEVGGIRDPRKGPRAQRLAQGAALALENVCKDECISLVSKMTESQSDGDITILSSLARRGAKDRPIQEQCAKTVVQKVEAELLGCCARTCGWNGTHCVLWSYMDKKAQATWNGECCTEDNILRNSSRERMCNSVLSPQMAWQMAANDTKQIADGDAAKVGQEFRSPRDDRDGSGLLQLRTVPSAEKEVCSVLGTSCGGDHKLIHWEACASMTRFAYFLPKSGGRKLKKLLRSAGATQERGLELEECAKKKSLKTLVWTSDPKVCHEVGGEEVMNTGSIPLILTERHLSESVTLVRFPQ
ncbi:unnamed protein product [Symbiodinium sp. CCMP2592]|nr:unnamed protein product [Symbiodinium sp. CCMP2592]